MSSLISSNVQNWNLQNKVHNRYYVRITIKVLVCLFFTALVFRLCPTGQIYVRGIFVEHSHNIFPEYLEKFPMKFRGIFPNNVPAILKIEIFPDCFTNILPTSHAFFLSGSRNTIVDKAIPGVCWVSLKIWYFRESLVSMWPLRITV